MINADLEPVDLTLADGTVVEVYRKRRLGPTIHSNAYSYLGIRYPWHVFQYIGEGVPELRYVKSATFIDDETKTSKFYDALLPDDDSYI